jgi:hypothetical protein
MKTFYISYSSGITQEYICKSLLAAKQEASKGFTYAMELQGESVTIYDSDDNAICYKSFNRFTEKTSNLGKWITI